jgi:large conductance mechanosensitive channel protein
MKQMLVVHSRCESGCGVAARPSTLFNRKNCRKVGVRPLDHANDNSTYFLRGASNICDGYKEVRLIVDSMTNFVESLKVISRKDAAGKITQSEVSLQWGAFLTAVIDFIIVAFVMFLIIKAINSLKKKEPEAPPPPTPEDVILLREIRDALKK